MKTIIKNIKEIIGVSLNEENELKKGKKLNKTSIIKNGWIAIKDGLIVDFGTMHDWPGLDNWNTTTIIDADNGYVLPSWCDSHTHLVFSGSRENEFVDRINGLSYEEIAQNGGGILNSAQLLSQTSQEDLYNQSKERVDEVIRMGTGALEIKSGYGLNTKDEIKMLQV